MPSIRRRVVMVVLLAQPTFSWRADTSSITVMGERSHRLSSTYHSLLVRVSGSISFTSQTVGLLCRLIVTRKVYNVNHRRGGPRSADS